MDLKDEEIGGDFLYFLYLVSSEGRLVGLNHKFCKRVRWSLDIKLGRSGFPDLSLIWIHFS